MTGRTRLFLVTAALVVFPVRVAAADTADASAPPRLHRGAVELGLAGTVLTDGGTTVALGLRGGRFFGIRGALFALEADAGWTRVRELDGLDLLASAQWMPWPAASVVPFAGAAVGVREEWIGSFREARAPIGGVLGVRALAGRSAAFRAEYRYLRVTGDPVRNHGEHRIQFGVSVLLGNRPDYAPESSPE